MLDIKKCRKIKRDCTAKNEGKNIILDLSDYPTVSLIITHGDGKSWGYFYDLESHVYLGRCNQTMVSPIFRLGDRYVSRNDVKRVVTDSPEIERVYKEFLNRPAQMYNNWWTARELQNVFRVNPVLFTNLVDSGCFRGIKSWNREDKFSQLVGLENYRRDFDFTKPLIKDAFHLSPGWIRIMFSQYRVSLDKIEYIKAHNYTSDEVIEIGPYIFNVPDEYICNKDVVKLWCVDWTYRDYLNMRTELPKEVRKQFPLLPKDLKKQHDKILPVYNRNLILKRERELDEKQKAYMEKPYNEAIKYEYSDENYSIIACRKLVDLLFEGNTLSHCVGSYVNSVSAGKEYILFLRKNSDIDTPYFTVDLTPEKEVRQIHGYRNCNITSDIRPFVEAWAKKFKLDISGCSGVRCALY